MIEVNLLPGGRKGSGGGFSLSSLKLPSLGSLGGGGGGGGRDNYQLFFAGALVIALGYIGWSFMGVRGDTADLEVRLETARQDSITYNSTIQRIQLLEARSDSIASRVQIIQDIDAGRFVWGHLLDEIATAVPDYTWLREILYQSDGPLTVRISGRAGSLLAVTNFMTRLEASRFLRGVDLQTSGSVPSESNPEDIVVEFELVLTYVAPPLDEMETVPLFDQATSIEASPNPGN